MGSGEWYANEPPGWVAVPAAEASELVDRRVILVETPGAFHPDMRAVAAAYRQDGADWVDVVSEFDWYRSRIRQEPVPTSRYPIDRVWVEERTRPDRMPSGYDPAIHPRAAGADRTGPTARWQLGGWADPVGPTDPAGGADRADPAPLTHRPESTDRAGLAAPAERGGPEYQPSERDRPPPAAAADLPPVLEASAAALAGGAMPGRAQPPWTQPPPMDSALPPIRPLRMRRPRPARDVADLTGRRVVVLQPAGPVYHRRAVSEPYLHQPDGDPSVTVCSEYDWYRWAITREPPRADRCPLYLVWVE